MLETVYKKKENIFEIIVRAGNEIIKVYQSNDFQVEMKSDQTPLTTADRKSNQVIVNGLKELFPQIPILSEESKKIPYQVRERWEYLWIVDPLDGTKEFIKKNGEFSINLALIKNNDPVFGIIDIPVLDVLYYAMKGKGAYKREGDGALFQLPFENTKKQIKKAVNTRIRMICSKSHYTEETKRYVDRISKHYSDIEMISVGSAIKFVYLAENKADIYPRLAPTMEWDIAAGQMILEETGGKIVDYQRKKPLMYNKEDLKNPWFVAVNHQNLTILDDRSLR